VHTMLLQFSSPSSGSLTPFGSLQPVLHKCSGWFLQWMVSGKTSINGVVSCNRAEVLVHMYHMFARVCNILS
jgi:hypothetical protein